MINDDVRAACEACVGRVREVFDTLAPETTERLATLLNASKPREHLPPTWHWAYFNSAIPQSELGEDGHEHKGRFLPPAPFHRRMWAGGEITVYRPLHLEVPAIRRSEVTSVNFKQGRSGAMCFVNVRHSIDQSGSRAIEEDQTIVYRDRGIPDIPLRDQQQKLPDGFFTHPDSQLFFYSALTHNGHRIHWDSVYCREVEGYPDLVVHGPLLATELCDAMREGLMVCSFAYRATAPVFATTPVRIDPGLPGKPREGKILRSDGVTSMVAHLKAL